MTEIAIHGVHADIVWDVAKEVPDATTGRTLHVTQVSLALDQNACQVGVYGLWDRQVPQYLEWPCDDAPVWLANHAEELAEVFFNAGRQLIPSEPSEEPEQ